MEEICRQYWYPVYAFLRRYGFSSGDAEDLTQEFFGACISRETLHQARSEKGRLRSFLLHMLRQLAANQLRHRQALKRGGGLEIVSLDAADPEERYRREPAETRDPGLLFDRAWAARLLAAAMERLREDFARGDNLDDFEQLKEYLPFGESVTPYAEAARRLGVSESALRLQIHRMRKRWGKHIDAEIAETVSDPEDRKAERDYLLGLIQVE